MNIDSKFIFYISFSDNPGALINALFLNNGAYFGLRGRHDHVNMTWGDIQLKSTSGGQTGQSIDPLLWGNCFGGVINIDVYSGDRKNTISCSQ